MRTFEERYGEIEKMEFFYLHSEEDLMKFYRKIIDILEDFNFDRIEEAGMTQYLTAVPKINPNIEATKEKDPYTNIEITIGFRFKSPHPHMETSEDLFKVELHLEGEVTTDFPKETRLDRSFISKIFQKILNFFVYRKEKEKYWEECEETLIEISNRAREIYKSLPSIGKSRREYYKPEFR